MPGEVKLSVSIVIPDQIRKDRSKDKYLLVLNKKTDFWSLPSGKLDHGENPRQALQRESREEIGTEVNTVKFLGIYQFISTNRNWITNFTYMGVPLETPKIVRPNEISELEWFTLRQINDLKTIGKLRSHRGQINPIENYQNLEHNPSEPLIFN
jgi:ADP-ribose pyrophosphatase YjhB (NUDIX family)